ncbi:MAG: hypothetical protein PF481_11630 [Bacteroidales bacterium]|jgi:hypothetical protein|nr:hypothetical protein [Bacteroidales bacterium]
MSVKNNSCVDSVYILVGLHARKPQYYKDLTTKMSINERKYLDTYIQTIGHEIPTLLKNFDFSENAGGFDFLTKASAVYII